MVNETEHKGSCLCGAVRVLVTKSSNSVGVCHCKTCRTWGGGPLFAVDCGTEVTFSSEDHITVFQSSDWAERGFCRTCGSHLFYRLRQNGHYILPVGLLEDGSAWNFDHQVFIDEKPDFYAFANETKDMTGAELFAKYSGGS